MSYIGISWAILQTGTLMWIRRELVVSRLDVPNSYPRHTGRSRPRRACGRPRRQNDRASMYPSPSSQSSCLLHFPFSSLCAGVGWGIDWCKLDISKGDNQFRCSALDGEAYICKAKRRPCSGGTRGLCHDAGGMPTRSELNDPWLLPVLHP